MKHCPNSRSHGTPRFLGTSSILGTAIVYAAIASQSLSIRAQELPLPELFKDQKLTVNIEASVFDGLETVAWESNAIRFTVPGNPVGVKLVGSNVIILMQITPFDDGKDGLVLVSQGQIWVRAGEGGLSYRTTLDTVSVRYGERILFFPLGRNPDGRTPIRLVISVDRYRETDAAQAAATVPGLGLPPPEAAKNKK